MTKFFGEKRKFKRLALSVPIDLRVVDNVSLKPVTKSTKGTMLDLTPAGARIEVHEIVVDGLHLFYDVNNHSRRKLEIIIDMPDESGKVSLFGRMTRYRVVQGGSPASFIFGIELSDIKPEERKRLHGMLFNLGRSLKEH